MDMKEICPCPNSGCPNHGFCDKCTSRHVRIGYLNYCAFQTMLPALQQTIDANPETQTSKDLRTLIEIQSKSYEELMGKNGLSPENQDRLLKMVSEYGDY